MDNLILEIVDNGIDVTISKDRYGELYFDLNFQAKSYGHLYKRPEGWLLQMRYSQQYVNDLDDIIYCFLHTYDMRGFGSQSWIDLCTKREIRLPPDQNN